MFYVFHWKHSVPAPVSDVLLPVAPTPTEPHSSLPCPRCFWDLQLASMSHCFLSQWVICQPMPYGCLDSVCLPTLTNCLSAEPMFFVTLCSLFYAFIRRFLWEGFPGIKGLRIAWDTEPEARNRITPVASQTWVSRAQFPMLSITELCPVRAWRHGLVGLCQHMGVHPSYSPVSFLSPSDGPTERPGDPPHGQPAGGHMGPTTPREPEWEHPGLQGKISCMTGLFLPAHCVPRAPKGLAAHWLYCRTAVCPAADAQLPSRPCVPGAGLVGAPPGIKATWKRLPMWLLCAHHKAHLAPPKVPRTTKERDLFLCPQHGLPGHLLIITKVGYPHKSGFQVPTLSTAH